MNPAKFANKAEFSAKSSQLVVFLFRSDPTSRHRTDLERITLEVPSSAGINWPSPSGQTPGPDFSSDLDSAEQVLNSRPGTWGKHVQKHGSLPSKKDS